MASSETLTHPSRLTCHCRRKTDIFVILVAIALIVYGLFYADNGLLQAAIKAVDGSLYKNNQSIWPRFNTIDNGGEIPKCSKVFLKRYFAKHGNFPNTGQWTSDNVYQPEHCSFRRRGYSGRPASCLNGKYVAVVGDSNGARYYAEMKNMLERLTEPCMVIKQEAGDIVPDKSYMAQGNATLEEWMFVNGRYCSGCTSEKVSCEGQMAQRSARTSVVLEMMAMTALHDITVGVRVPQELWHPLAEERHAAESFQEFLFRYYFRDRYPDILILYVPISHVKHRTPLALIRTELTYFSNLVDAFVPNSTQVFWMPTPAEFESRKNERWRNYRFDGLLATGRIRLLNALMYDVIGAKLRDPASNTHGFIDLLNMSIPKELWSTDGVHMKRKWYKIVMSYLMQIICSE